MAYTIGKRLTAYPPRPMPSQGMNAFLTGGLAKVGSVLTLNTGLWQSSWGTTIPAIMWFVGGASAYASATNLSYSCSANDSTKGLSARVRMGNASWGTTEVWARTGTVAP